jgi:hypothetical protein
MQRKLPPPRKAVGYFSEDKLLSLMADLNNERSNSYIGLCNCLEAEYAKKVPEGLLVYSDIKPSELMEILEADNRVQVLMTTERYKKYHSNTWVGRILTWLAR